LRQGHEDLRASGFVCVRGECLRKLVAAVTNCR